MPLDEAPKAVEYVPAAQYWQAALDATAIDEELLYVPAAHSEQALIPLPLAYEPNAHDRHAELAVRAPPVAYVPGGHDWHTTDASVPIPLAVAYCPAGHAAHALLSSM